MFAVSNPNRCHLKLTFSDNDNYAENSKLISFTVLVILSGTGTILVDHDFLFTVRHPNKIYSVLMLFAIAKHSCGQMLIVEAFLYVTVLYSFIHSSFLWKRFSSCQLDMSGILYFKSSNEWIKVMSVSIRNLTKPKETLFWCEHCPNKI